MATRFSSTLHPYQATDTDLRNNATFIQDTLVTTGGWVYVSQTGDSDPSTLVHTTVTNTKVGFRVYRMADSLQATSPVYMRVDWGSGANASGANFVFWVTLGTGADGSGGITGQVLAATQILNTSSNSSTVVSAYGSADTNRVALALFISTNTTFPLIFTLERTKDSGGADTGDGLLLVYNTTTSVGNSRCLILAGGTQPSVETGLNYVLTSKNPSETFSPGDIGVGVVIHFKGVAQQPGLNFIVTNSSDVAAEGNFTVTLYGSTRTYQHCNAITPTKGLAASSSPDSGARCNIRYD